MFDLGVNTSDTRKVQSDITTIYNNIIIPFIVKAGQKSLLFIFLVHDHQLGISCILVCCSEYEVLFSKNTPTSLSPE